MKYINYLPLYGRGAMFNFVEAPRDVGKTFTAKLWGIRRFLKTVNTDHVKRFIWVRRTDEEKEAAKKSFFKKKKLLQMLGLTADDVRVHGDYGYIKRGKKWVECVEFCSLSTAATQRSVDDETYTTMFVDEAFATPAKVRAFKGDEVREFIDLYFSKKRDHKLTAFLLGNKETINNPYYEYFKIPPPPIGFEGVRMFNNGTIAVWHITDFVCANDHDKVRNLLRGTSYDAYMFDGAAKCMTAAKYAEPPRKAQFYCAIDFGTPVTVLRVGGTFYARAGVDKHRVVFVSRETQHKYNRAIICGRSDKGRFWLIGDAYKRGAIYHTTPLVSETLLAALEKIGVVQ